MKKEKTVIIIAGPTASGKTALSLQLASEFNTSIISADSRQCFKELNIGVAKPPAEALQSIKHYFINSHSIHDVVNAKLFEEYALTATQKIFETNDVAVMVGGTGMYIKAFCEGLDDIPAVDENTRASILSNYAAKGLGWLQQEVQTKMPGFWNISEQQNPQRLMRALEVFESTGESIASFQNKNKVHRDFRIIKFGINISKEQLHKNINNRVDEMIKEGLVDEVKSLLPFKNNNALQTVGYKELFGYLSDISSLDEAIEKIKLNTRHYAKRQLTWFRKDKEINWLENDYLKLSGSIQKFFL